MSERAHVLAEQFERANHELIALAVRHQQSRRACTGTARQSTDDCKRGRSMRIQHVMCLTIAAILSLAFWAVTAAAGAAEPTWDLPARLVDEPPGIAQLRAQYAPMTEAQLTAAGFEIDPLYVTADLVGLPAATGVMGYHAIHPGLMGAQFPQGVMDPQRPPVVLLGPDKRVIGVEWEAADRGQAPPQLYGQTANLGPPHPGVDHPHYMLHAFFRPGGKVLFGDFDPALAGPGLPNTGAGGAGRQAPLPPAAAAVLAALCGAGALLTRRRDPRGRAVR
jgi:hypothetical protein